MQILNVLFYYYFFFILNCSLFLCNVSSVKWKIHFQNHNQHLGESDVFVYCTKVKWSFIEE